MENRAKPTAALDPRKQQLLSLLLREQGLAAPKAPIRPQPRTRTVFPTSYAQERLWLTMQIEPDNAGYNLQTSLLLTGDLALPVLERTVEEIVRRHQTLRTTYGMADGQPMQVVAPPAPVAVPLVDLAALPAAACDEETARLAAEDEALPFDLARGPVLRVLVFRCRADQHGAFLTIHHIASDGWSTDVLVREVGALYQAFRLGRPSPLPPLPIQYADFAVWQRETLGERELAGSVDYWRRKLAGVPVLQLPTDRPRPAVAGFAGSTVELEIAGRELRLGLAALGREAKATLFMAVTALFQALLARYTGQRDVSVGTPIANRRNTETEALIGFFVNTLVLRSDLSGDPTARELLERVQRVVAEAFAHGQLPFSRLVLELNPERSRTWSPLFQVLCMLGNIGQTKLTLPGLALAPLDSVRGNYSLTDLGLTVMDTERGTLLAQLDYKTELYDRATAERLLAHLAVLLAAAVEDPGRRLSELPLLRPAERFQTLVEWNDTASPSPAVPSLQAPFEAWAAAAPERTAVAFGELVIRYGDLDRRADRLAWQLRDLGVDLETRVGLALPRSPEMVVAILAVLKAGGAYVPLDPTYPAERLAFMLADSRAQVLLLPAGAETPPWAGTVRALRIGDPVAGEGGTPVAGAGDPARALRPPLTLHPESLAYVIYTSGSTGRPKGAAIPHRAIANTLRAFPAFALTRDDRVLQFASSSFDASLLEILPVFSAGACLVLSERETAAAPELSRELARRRITVAALTPSALAVVPEGSFPDLRSLLCAAEALPVELVRRWAPGRELWNIYGPTEAAIFATAWRAGKAPVVLPPPIGRPIPGMRAFVLDEAGEPSPIGIPGELLLGGPGLGRGYLDRPEQTAATFVPDPFSGLPGERLYRTGDRARTLADGQIDYQGRIDHQVKVRGFRIELGEVETALLAHPSVREAAAGVQKDPRGDRLVAGVVLQEGDDVGPLRDFLRRRLPEPMVPGLILARASLPRTGSGKLDRQALFASGALEPAAPAHSFAPPRTPVEEILAEVWAEVLGLAERRVSRDDGFFELGGHSLLATQVGHRLREIFGIELPLARLFESPTLADLAREVDAARRGDAAPAEVEPIVPLPRDRPLPASIYQQWMWELQGEPVSAKFNVSSPLLLSGPLHLETLERALGEVVRRHETLRTTFHWDDGQLLQVVAQPAGWLLPVVDLTGLPAERRQALTVRLAAEELDFPFDLERGPLVSARILDLAPDEHALLLNMHHIVSDGWSLAVLQAEVSTLYAAFLAGRTSPLPDLAVQYADFAAWQRRTLAGPELRQKIEAWRRRLADRPSLLEIPADRPRPETLDPASYRDDLTLVGEPATRVQSFARTMGCTTAMVLVAAIHALLHRYSGRTDLLVNIVFSARDRPVLARLIGFFMNTVPLRTDLSGEPTFRELLWRVRADVLAAYSHQDLPFPQLLGALFPGQTLHRTLLSRVLFNMLSFAGAPEGPETDGPPLAITPFAQADEPAKNDLTLTAREAAGFLEVNVVGATDILLPESVVHIRQDLEALLMAVVAEPETRIDRLLPTLHHRPALPGPEWRGERSG